MSLVGKRGRVLLVLLLAAAGFAAYEGQRRYRASSHYRAALRALEQRDFRQAALSLDAYLKIRPDDSEARLLAAQTARRRGRWDEALEQLSLCQKGGGSADALARENQLLRAQQGEAQLTLPLLAFCFDHPEASETRLVLEACIEGILTIQARALAEERAARGQHKLVDVSQAQRAVELWLRSYPARADQVQGHVWLGLIEALARDYPKARSHFREALALDPDHFQARLSLAELLAQDAPVEATAHLDRLRRRDPENARVRFRLAVLRHDLGQLEEAREALDEILAAEPDHVAALVERGKVALDEQNLAAAERCLRRALALSPGQPGARQALSRCLTQAGKKEEAERLRAPFPPTSTGRKREQPGNNEKPDGSQE